MSKILIGDRLLVRGLDINKVFNKNGSVNFKNINNQYVYGEVVMTGPGLLSPQATPPGKNDQWRTEEEIRSQMYYPLLCSVGDKIFFPNEASQQIFLDGEIHYIVSEPHVVLGLREDD